MYCSNRITMHVLIQWGHSAELLLMKVTGDWGRSLGRNHYSSVSKKLSMACISTKLKSFDRVLSQMNFDSQNLLQILNDVALSNLLIFHHKLVCMLVNTLFINLCLCGAIFAKMAPQKWLHKKLSMAKLFEKIYIPWFVNGW